jgi:serine/threonine protein kinase
VKQITMPVNEEPLFREVENLVKLNHPCILRIFRWALPTITNKPEIHMEFAENNSLKDVLKRVNSGDKPAFWNATGIGILICGFVLGMRYVHRRGIVHHDLKPSNILITREGHARIGDFGSSCAIDNDATPREATVCYAAPELYEGDAKCTTKSDVFSFGMVLYEILARKPVFHSSEPPFTVIRRLRAGDLPPIPVESGPVMQELIPKCWQRNPDERPSFQDILNLFDYHHFAILPGADETKIAEFHEDILDWEERAGIRI